MVPGRLHYRRLHYISYNFQFVFLEDDEEEGMILVDDEEEEMILVDEGMICFFEGKIS